MNKLMLKSFMTFLILFSGISWAVNPGNARESAAPLAGALDGIFRFARVEAMYLPGYGVNVHVSNAIEKTSPDEVINTITNLLIAFGSSVQTEPEEFLSISYLGSESIREPDYEIVFRLRAGQVEIFIDGVVEHVYAL